MKVIFISDDGKQHRRFTVDIWFHILLPLILLSIGLYSTEKLSSFLSSKDKVGYRQAHTLEKQDQEHSFVTMDHTLDLNIEEKIELVEADILSTEENIKISIKELKKNRYEGLLDIDDVDEYLSTLPKIISLSDVNKNPPLLTDYNFMIPVKHGYISSSFGYRKHPINGRRHFHSGIDIAAAKNSNIYAIANGFVTYAGRKGAYGNLLEINHSKSVKSRYAHLNSFSVESGQLVKKGDLIGKVGSTGRVTGPHLHLEIKENNKAVNPYAYLKTALKTLR